MRHVPRSRLLRVGMLVILLTTSALWAQTRQEIQFPDIMGYRTLKCDLHMHTVFSDGAVWPTVRVEEAWREGLDAISITDHIEYQPHKNDIPTNHNRPYEIALPRAKSLGILLVRGTEITRDTPPGHFNAIFLEDIAPLDTKDLLDCMAAADKQGAFIWWNHPDWIPDKKGWFDIHTTLYEKKYMRGIEVVNGDDYYPDVHRWALEKNLTFMGNTDIHAPSTLESTTPDRHRSMTLVFARDKTLAALKEALVAGRTTVWYQNQLIGRPEYLRAIFHAATAITDIEYSEDGNLRFALRNDADVPLEMERSGKFGPKSVTVPPHAVRLIQAKVPASETAYPFEYVVNNFVAAPGQGLAVCLEIPPQITIEIDVETQAAN
ncbi:MAG TPA: Sb-PDE family phosphodiesterase [Sedimentisphaerales bacterium]|nr:Sb-PDE family phosphodiesterase [Sedimentisphaerales bacterium]HRS12668.1 Sb-PDE family phosphodiesterase [Sedimentisphaerales bacterium]HRV49768.1 Sb-PDE family phosphodiesterase [Sedimentisphaerales bacterium]